MALTNEELREMTLLALTEPPQRFSSWTPPGLPDEIRVIYVPSDLYYREGELIDYSGVIVRAYLNGTVWTSDDYPDGFIPFAELSFVADTEHISGDSMVSDLIDHPIYIGEPPVILAPTSTSIHVEGGQVGCLIVNRDTTGWYIMVASSEPFTGIWYETWDPDPTHRNEHPLSSSGGPTYDGKTVYYWYLTSGGFSSKARTNMPINEDYGYTPFDRGLIAWTMVYGTPTAAHIPIIVTWPRAGDGVILSSSFDIPVLYDSLIP